MVVLPTPPFWLAMARTCGARCGMSDTVDRSDFHYRRLLLGQAGMDLCGRNASARRRRRSPYAPSRPWETSQYPPAGGVFPPWPSRSVERRERPRRDDVGAPAAAAPRCGRRAPSTVRPAARADRRAGTRPCAGRSRRGAPRRLGRLPPPRSPRSPGPGKPAPEPRSSHAPRPRRPQRARAAPNRRSAGARRRVERWRATRG